MQPGVYFGLPEEEYFAADALGSSDLKMLARSPADWWWWSRYNPLRPAEVDSDGKRFGSALHKRLLEGSSAYDAAYFLKPSPPEKTVRTMDDMRSLLDFGGHAYKKSSSKPDLIAVFRQHYPDHTIYDDWAAAVMAQNAGKLEISEAWDASIRLMAQVVESHPQLKDAFIGGAPEVSIFWHADGVTKRARLDYLQPNAIFDLKSMSNWRGDDFRKAAIREIASRRYDAQASHYREARIAGAQLFADGHVFGDAPSYAAQLFAPEFLFVFVFMQTIGSPRALPLLFADGNAAAERGVSDNQRAIANFIDYRNRFGLTDMWVEVDELFTPTLDDWAQASFWR